MRTPQEEPGWEVTGDIPDHVRRLVEQEVNGPHFPTPRELETSLAKWGQYPPPTTEDTMERTRMDRIRTWVAGIPWRYTMWLAYRRQARERARFQRDY